MHSSTQRTTSLSVSPGSIQKATFAIDMALPQTLTVGPVKEHACLSGTAAPSQTMGIEQDYVKVTIRERRGSPSSHLSLSSPFVSAPLSSHGMNVWPMDVRCVEEPQPIEFGKRNLGEALFQPRSLSAEDDLEEDPSSSIDSYEESCFSAPPTVTSFSGLHKPIRRKPVPTLDDFALRTRATTMPSSPTTPFTPTTGKENISVPHPSAINRAPSAPSESQSLSLPERRRRRRYSPTDPTKRHAWYVSENVWSSHSLESWAVDDSALGNRAMKRTLSRPAAWIKKAVMKRN